MNHQMEPHIHLSHTISVCMTEKDFLRRVKMTPPDMTALLHSGEAELLGKALQKGNRAAGTAIKSLLRAAGGRLAAACLPAGTRVHFSGKSLRCRGNSGANGRPLVSAAVSQGTVPI